MTPDSIRNQLTEVYRRLIGSNLSVQQNGVSTRMCTLGGKGKNKIPVCTVGDLPPCNALRNIAYGHLYADILNNNAYHIKMIDGGLLSFQYIFSHPNNELLKHRLAFFPSHLLPTIEEAPELYRRDNLYADIVQDRLVRFPIRFDFDPANYTDMVHPKSHLTLGQFEACRIPVAGPVLPYTFVLFILRNFYSLAYQRNRNEFDKRCSHIPTIFTISEAERRMAHFVMGRNFAGEYAA